MKGIYDFNSNIYKIVRDINILILFNLDFLNIFSIQFKYNLKFSSNHLLFLNPFSNFISVFSGFYPESLSP